jgi:hypothetical protein
MFFRGNFPLKFSRFAPMSALMSLSASALDSVYRSVDTREEFGIAVLKKAQDQARQEASALIESIAEQPTPAETFRLDTYA